ncbi:hypothetical protein ACIQ4Z_01785 [Peribacillus asahii]|uniref:hypothetical protein n=1 Tax=Peribacillus asahii TaxID=228899 RepID=UPI0038111D50
MVERIPIESCLHSKGYLEREVTEQLPFRSKLHTNVNEFIIQIGKIVEEQASADVEIEKSVITTDKIQKKVEQ